MFDLLTWLWLAFKAAAITTGGFGPLPVLHDELLARGWATEAMFTEAVAVGQASPGPNGLWVISLGYLMGGVPGALLALLGLSLPPITVVLVERVYARIGHHVATRGFLDGMALAIGGTILVIFARLWQGPVEPRALLITLGAIVLAGSKRVPVFAIVFLAALAGMLLYA